MHTFSKKCEKHSKCQGQGGLIWVENVNIEKINLYLLGDINKFIDCNMEMTPLVEELKKLDDPSELVI